MEYSQDKQKQLSRRQNDIMKKETMDWRCPYMEYLTCKKIFNQDLTQEEKRTVEKHHMYFVFTNGTLRKIRKGRKKNQVCIPSGQVPVYLAKIHEGSKPHLAPIETWKAIATGLYWWPTWENDIGKVAKTLGTVKKKRMVLKISFHKKYQFFWIGDVPSHNILKILTSLNMLTLRLASLLKMV